MNDQQIKTQAFKANIKKAHAIEMQILAEMNGRQKDAWQRQIGTHLCSIMKNIRRIETRAKEKGKRLPTDEQINKAVEHEGKPADVPALKKMLSF